MQLDLTYTLSKFVSCRLRAHVQNKALINKSLKVLHWVFLRQHFCDLRKSKWVLIFNLMPKSMQYSHNGSLNLDAIYVNSLRFILLQSIAATVEGDDEVVKIQESIRRGVMEIAKPVQEPLTYWDQFREIWEHSKDEIINQYRAIKLSAVSINADISRYVVLYSMRREIYLTL